MKNNQSAGVQNFYPWLSDTGTARCWRAVKTQQWQQSVLHQEWAATQASHPPCILAREHRRGMALPAASWARTASRSRASLLARVFSVKYCANNCIIAHQTEALKLVSQNPSRDSRGWVFHLEMFQVKQNHPFLIKCFLILKSALRPVLIAQSSFHQDSYYSWVKPNNWNP